MAHITTHLKCGNNSGGNSVAVIYISSTSPPTVGTTPVNPTLNLINNNSPDRGSNPQGLRVRSPATLYPLSYAPPPTRPPTPFPIQPAALTKLIKGSA